MLKDKTAPLLCLILAASLVGLGASRRAVAEVDKQEEYKWYRTLYEGRCEEAFALAPALEHGTDSLLHLARRYEDGRERQEAIATYKRILAEDPDTPYAAQINFCLGELHCSIPLPAYRSTLSQRERSMGKISEASALPYFGEAVRVGERLDPYVVGSRLYLAGAGLEKGNKPAALDTLNEIASLSIYDVTTADYRGPYMWINSTEQSYCERLDFKRKVVLQYRNSARRILLELNGNTSPTAEQIDNYPVKREPIPASSRTLPNPLPFVENPIDADITPALERVKSDDQSVREEAVAELLSLRQCVAEELIDIVEDANRGKLNEHSKAMALYLMGELRLLQCRELLEQEKSWKYRPNLAFGWIDDRLFENIVGLTATNALGRAGFNESATLTAWHGKTSLKRYPALKQALTALRTSEWAALFAVDHPNRSSKEERWYMDKLKTAIESILRWNENVSRAMSKVIEFSIYKDLYSDDVKCTAAFVMGEYRTWHDYWLQLNIDLRDVNNVCTRYAKTMKVDTPEQDYPCVVALLKTILWIRGYIAYIEAHPEITAETRARILRVMLAVNPADARTEYEEELAAYQKPASGDLTEEKRLERLHALEAIEPLMREYNSE